MYAKGRAPGRTEGSRELLNEQHLWLLTFPVMHKLSESNIFEREHYAEICADLMRYIFVIWPDIWPNEDETITATSQSDSRSVPLSQNSNHSFGFLVFVAVNQLATELLCYTDA